MRNFPIHFRRLMWARFYLTLGTQVQTIILGWHMYYLTHDALFLGLVGLAEAIPAITMAFFAGPMVDRGCPLKFFQGLIGLSILSALLMLLGQLEFFNLSTNARILNLFLASVLTGLSRAFAQPSNFALVPRLIDKEKLRASSAWLTSSLQVARVSGPALGGLLYGLVGVTYSGLVSLAFISLALWIAFQIKLANPATKISGQSKNMVVEIREGLRFVFSHKILFWAMTVDMVCVLFGGVTALLPIYAAEILVVGPTGLGILRAAPAFGAALMGLFLTTKDLKNNSGKIFLSSVFGFGLSILVFSISKNFYLSLAALFCSGALDSVSMVIRTSIVQLSSPDHMRGRVSSINSIFVSSSNELGEFESGLAAKIFGVVPGAILGGLACLGFVSFVWWKSPELRQMDLSQLKN